MTTDAIEKSPGHPVFIDEIHGIIVEPLVTLSGLDEVTDEDEIKKNSIRIFNMVTLALTIVGLSRGTPHSFAGSALLLVLAVAQGMINWIAFALILRGLCRAFGVESMSWRKSLVLTGLPFTILILQAPISCFSEVLGQAVILLMVIPNLWFLLLEFLSFKVALKASNLKLIILGLTLPPVLALIYGFWMFAVPVLILLQGLAFSY
ncbi:MAG: hypothetical protein IPM23_10380 [Candidatus Melainabacteria bacterium]|nr:hypothetical protein [Candidatus Melainabacteria bacterium]